MSEFTITCSDFEEGEEIPKRCGYKHGNEEPSWRMNMPDDAICLALIMDDPDAMGAVGKVWVHHLWYNNITSIGFLDNEDTKCGTTDFGEIGYGGPAPPDKRHTYIFKAYALDVSLHLKKGFSKQELEDAMKDHIIAEAKLTGTFAP